MDCCDGCCNGGFYCDGYCCADCCHGCWWRGTDLECCYVCFGESLAKCCDGLDAMVDLALDLFFSPLRLLAEAGSNVSVPNLGGESGLCPESLRCPDCNLGGEGGLCARSCEGSGLTKTALAATAARASASAAIAATGATAATATAPLRVLRPAAALAPEHSATPECLQIILQNNTLDHCFA